jgi:hypothetical protein
MPISLKNAPSILPYVRYSPQNNSMKIAGEDGKLRDVSFLNKALAIDIENGVQGWLCISEGFRDWRPFPISNVTLPAPGANYRRGFSILLYAPKLLGSPEAHEMCSSTGAHMSFCERLYNETELGFGRGNVPIVKITEAEPVKVGRGKSRELKFAIVKWVPRPAAITEALAKLKSANNNTTSNKDDHTADTDDDDFDDDDDVTTPKAEKVEPLPKKPKKAVTDEAKGHDKKEKPAQSSMSDLIGDEIPFG